jgi:hypothetical protein
LVSGTLALAEGADTLAASGSVGGGGSVNANPTGVQCTTSVGTCYADGAIWDTAQGKANHKFRRNADARPRGVVAEITAGRAYVMGDQYPIFAIPPFAGVPVPLVAAPIEAPIEQHAFARPRRLPVPKTSIGRPRYQLHSSAAPAGVSTKVASGSARAIGCISARATPIPGGYPRISIPHPVLATGERGPTRDEMDALAAILRLGLL